MSQSYVGEWQGGFNAAIRGYLYRLENFSNYGDIRAYFEIERQNILQDSHFKDAASNVPKGPLKYQLLHMQKSGFSAEFLGRMDGLWQAMQFLQIAFGRYSYERRGLASDIRVRGRQPKASLASYQYRRNKTDTVLNDPDLVDTTVLHLRILDSINENVWPKIWPDIGRSLYANSDRPLLMPGLNRIDALSREIQDNDETLAQARQRYTRAASSLWVGANFGDKDDMTDLTNIRSTHNLLDYLAGTACLVHSFYGYKYAGKGLENLLAMYVAPDVYPQEEIDYPWGMTVAYWQEQDAAEARRDKTPAKKPDISEARRQAGRQKYLEAVEAFEKARQANLDAVPDDVLEKLEARLREERERRAIKRENMRKAQLRVSSSGPTSIEGTRNKAKRLAAHVPLLSAQEVINIQREKIETKKREWAERKRLRKLRREAMKNLTQQVKTREKPHKIKIKKRNEHSSEMNRARIQILKDMRDYRKNRALRPLALTKVANNDENIIK